jgi:hypothetical protein
MEPFTLSMSVELILRNCLKRANPVMEVDNSNSFKVKCSNIFDNVSFAFFTNGFHVVQGCLTLCVVYERQVLLVCRLHEEENIRHLLHISLQIHTTAFTVQC